jgi:D-alanyl-D-alanine carboxypeptidase
MSAIDEKCARMANRLGIESCFVALAAPGREAIVAHRSGRHSWFQAASTGKHLTACAVLDLVGQGLIDPEASLGTYLADAPQHWQDRSILSLLRHTSGIPEYLEYVDGEDVPTSRADFMARYSHLHPIADEGAAWSYSNTNYILLGFLIAQVSNISYTAMVSELLGTSGATVASPDWVKQANATKLGPEACDEASSGREVIGDGDIAFTAVGALSWLKQLLSGKHDPLLFEPAILNSGRQSPYACGWFVDTLGSKAVAYHAGHYQGFTAMAYLDRAAGAGALAISDLAPGNTRSVRALTQAILEDFAPGSTPLSLPVITDTRPDLFATAKHQLIREGDTLERDCFAPELQVAIDKGGPVRGILNMWVGKPPESFDLVEDRSENSGRMRRYRLTYAERREHLLVGTDACDKIYWAWPL